METFSALLAICAGNSPVIGEFPSQRPVTLSFDIFFDLRLNGRLSKQSWGWWFETLSHPLWRHRNAMSWHHVFFLQSSPHRARRSVISPSRSKVAGYCSSVTGGRKWAFTADMWNSLSPGATCVKPSIGYWSNTRCWPCSRMDGEFGF